MRDTGVGIPARDLPHVFERFHRIEATKGRSHEGTGIGLALVHDWRTTWRLGARSKQRRRGNNLRRNNPHGIGPLAQEQIGGTRSLSSTSVSPGLFVEEALRWLHDEPEPEVFPHELFRPPDIPPSAEAATDLPRPRVVLADDNADMRDYVRRLLCQRFDVEAVDNGRAAMNAAREQRLDLILTDVMMPELDGFALLQEIRPDHPAGNFKQESRSSRALIDIFLFLAAR